MRFIGFQVLAFLLVAAPVSAPGRAAEDAVPKLTDRGYRGEFSRAGPVFVCTYGAGQKMKPGESGEIGYQPCLYIGPFAIGGDAAVLEPMGKPDETVPAGDGQTHMVYIFSVGGAQPYLVVTLDGKRIAAVQISGPAPIPDLEFNHITLGMPVAKLVERFGKPFAQTPVSTNGADLWSYRPWPFSFEVKDDIVTSIRIAEE